MAIDLDSLFKDLANKVVNDLGSTLDTTITYTRQSDGIYDVATGALTTTDTVYSNIKAPIEFIVSEEEEGRSERQARLYLSPASIGNNRPTLQDEVILTYAGAERVAQITDIRTYRGKQQYLYVLMVRF